MDYESHTADWRDDHESLAVLGIFIDIDDHADNVRLEKMLDAIAKTDYRGMTANFSGFSLDSLLPTGSALDEFHYYRYHGSLTTPVCHEAVVWTVCKARYFI